MTDCSISFIMHGIHKCSGSCLYCSAAKSMDYRDPHAISDFKYDFEAAKNTILSYTSKTRENIEKQGRKASLHVDIWGGNPLENVQAFKLTVDFLNGLAPKYFSKVELHTSGNGLELQSNDLVQYLIDNDIHYQLSHDGCGQWIRTGDIDPIYWDKTKDNIVKLTKLGKLDWINTCMSQRNPSPFENMDYWNKWRRENDLMDVPLMIKLNHIYPGTAPIDKKYLGSDNKYIKHGEIVGDLNFRGSTLDEYLHEFKLLSIKVLEPGIDKNPDWQPFVSYLSGQIMRWHKVDDVKNTSSCRRKQMGLQEENFAIDSLGKYCECNLVDSANHVLNPSCAQPDYCKNCRYKMQSECLPCGSENFPVISDEEFADTHCGYRYKWIQMLEEVDLFLKVMNDRLNSRMMLPKTEQMGIEKYNIYQPHTKNNNSCKCNTNNKKQPVYCIRDYI